MFSKINAAIASQCAHWRGNPPDFPRTQKNEGIVYRSSLKSWGIATPVCGLVRNDIFFFSAENNNLPYFRKKKCKRESSRCWGTPAALFGKQIVQIFWSRSHSAQREAQRATWGISMERSLFPSARARP